jgi:hypothetical protein
MPAASASASLRTSSFALAFGCESSLAQLAVIETVKQRRLRIIDGVKPMIVTQSHTWIFAMKSGFPMHTA